MADIPEFEITDFAPYPGGHPFIIGWVNIYFPEVGLMIHRAFVHRNARGPESPSPILVLMPKRQRPNKEGAIEYAPTVSFPDGRRFFAFGAAVVEALREQHPEAFTSPVPPSSFTPPQGVDHHA